RAAVGAGAEVDPGRQRAAEGGAQGVTVAEVQVRNRLGLHARAAARFVHLASRFRCRIRVGKDGAEVDGKSILGILTLAAVCRSTLRLSFEGEDEGEAASALRGLVEERFGEES